MKILIIKSNIIVTNENTQKIKNTINQITKKVKIKDCLKLVNICDINTSPL